MPYQKVRQRPALHASQKSAHLLSAVPKELSMNDLGCVSYRIFPGSMENPFHHDSIAERLRNEVKLQSREEFGSGSSKRIIQAIFPILCSESSSKGKEAPGAFDQSRMPERYRNLRVTTCFSPDGNEDSLDHQEGVSLRDPVALISPATQRLADHIADLSRSPDDGKETCDDLSDADMSAGGQDDQAEKQGDEILLFVSPPSTPKESEMQQLSEEDFESEWELLRKEDFEKSDS